MLLQCLQPGLKFKRSANPAFSIEFGEFPVEVSEVVGDFLLEKFEKEFIEVKKKTSKRVDKGVAR